MYLDLMVRVGVTAVVATLNGYTYRLFLSVSLLGSILGPSIRVIYSELLHSSFLSIYMGPVARQVDEDQAIQSILCCALYHYSYLCDSNKDQGIQSIQFCAYITTRIRVISKGSRINNAVQPLVSNGYKQ